MVDKKRAEKTEAELLAVFDYAWNICGNGACRREEILLKLDSKASSQINAIQRKLQLWKHLPIGRKVGIDIDACVPLDDRKDYLLPQVLKFGKSQLRFIDGNDSLNENHNICGVAIGRGSVCQKRPIFGKKRCEEHKGKKIIGTNPLLSRVVVTEENTSACGIALEDGSLCAELPAYGRKRCELHKGLRITKIQPHDMHQLPDLEETPILNSRLQSIKGVAKNEDNRDICGVIVGDGTICKNSPVWGRKRCVEHKGQKATGTRSKLPTSIESSVTKEYHDICGVVADGYVCRRRPVSGRKRCEEHKGRRIAGLT